MIDFGYSSGLSIADDLGKVGQSAVPLIPMLSHCLWQVESLPVAGGAAAMESAKFWQHFPLYPAVGLSSFSRGVPA
jgi:hypothetical protein